MTLSRTDLKKKARTFAFFHPPHPLTFLQIIASPEVLSVLPERPLLADLTKSLYDCHYDKFFKALGLFLLLLPRTSPDLKCSRTGVEVSASIAHARAARALLRTRDACARVRAVARELRRAHASLARGRVRRERGLCGCVRIILFTASPCHSLRASSPRRLTRTCVGGISLTTLQRARTPDRRWAVAREHRRGARCRRDDAAGAQDGAIRDGRQDGRHRARSGTAVEQGAVLNVRRNV
jgi:hypothetical protein